MSGAPKFRRRFLAAFLFMSMAHVGASAHDIPEDRLKDAEWACEEYGGFDLPIECEIAGVQMMESDHPLEERQRGFQLLAIGCNKGHAYACEFMAIDYLDEPIEVTGCPNKEQAARNALPFFKRACMAEKRTLRAACYRYQMAYALANGKEMPLSQRLKLLERDCLHTDAEACEQVALGAEKSGDHLKQYAFGTLACLRKGRHSEGCAAAQRARRSIMNDKPRQVSASR